MQVRSRVTSVSWIPSEAVTGVLGGAVAEGIRHRDDPPPEVLRDLESLRTTDGFLFANRLEAWAEFSGDRLVSHGIEGGGVMRDTALNVDQIGVSFPAMTMPELRGSPEIGDGSVRLTQTIGTRIALPAPVSGDSTRSVEAPVAWTTLAITLYSDGFAEYTLDGASPFPRHWVYGSHDVLTLKTGVTDWQAWTNDPGVDHTPWGDGTAATLLTAAETGLERRLSGLIMQGVRPPEPASYPAGRVVVRQGDPGDSLLLVLDGVLTVDVDGDRVAELGPGALIGERAVLDGGHRTATVTTITPVRVAEVPAADVDRSALEYLAGWHRAENR